MNQPLKLAVDTESVIGEAANGLRVRYRTNTEPGSSGCEDCLAIGRHDGWMDSALRRVESVAVRRVA